MRFSQADDYPTCGAFLQNALSMIDLLSPEVWEAFLDKCGSRKLARRAITYSQNPLVWIGGVPCGINGRYKGRSGGPKNIVYINTQVARKYEDERDYLIFESTVLHEMVHWARFLGDKPRLYNGEEAGKAFEIDAYGRDINCGCYTCE